MPTDGQEHEGSAVVGAPAFPLPTSAEDARLGNKEFWMMMRQALLLWLDAMERMLSITPRTAELRKIYKDAKRGAS